MSAPDSHALYTTPPTESDIEVKDGQVQISLSRLIALAVGEDAASTPNQAANLAPIGPLPSLQAAIAASQLAVLQEQLKRNIEQQILLEVEIQCQKSQAQLAKIQLEKQRVETETLRQQHELDLTTISQQAAKIEKLEAELKTTRNNFVDASPASRLSQSIGGLFSSMNNVAATTSAGATFSSAAALASSSAAESQEARQHAATPVALASAAPQVFLHT
ncbi:MAG: hypothetical protein M1561_05830 [Gammaproteobacteria bacterium]|nr:hypothetical protein [Gammaproteobacteria bacterium]